MKRNIAKLYLIAAAILLLSACVGEPENRVSGESMGTTYQVRQIDEKPVLAAKIEARLKQINKVFSTWDANSELSLLNKKPINKWLNITNELFFVLLEAKKIHLQTDGYFDPGIGNLIDLWGFGAVKNLQNLQKPSMEKVAKVLKNSSIRHLQFRPGMVKKTKNIRLNLSAIAKGYAVDEIAKLLLENGAENFLVELGGEVLVRGKNGKKAWVIGVERPNNSTPIAVKLTNQAIASSGDYRNFFVWQGQKYSHILQPKTGLPAKTNLAAVSVFHNQTMLADAYATAMMAMGSELAIKLAKRLNLSAIMVLNEANKFKILRINL
ncbi:MAG: FAD:protein FMN transferase [Candidatus Thioglobus sp.]|nr:FAD:protein FMN transferase [Candidatus Thioglobus sp.]